MSKGTNESTSRIATLIREYGPLTGVLGLVLYGLLRLAYAFFYLQLRTTPEEVGYGYSRVLSESVAGVVELMLLGAAVVSIPILLYYFARVVLPPRRSVRDVLRGLPRAAARRIAVQSVTIGAASLFLSLPGLAWWQGGLARQGETVRNLYFVGVPYLPVLAVQAVPADVGWKDDDTGKPFPLSGRDCLMYLGQANGTTVFYDVRTRDSIRLPSADITVILRFAPYVPDSCR